MLKKGIGVIVPLFDVTLSLLMLPSLRLPRFPFRLLLQVRGRMMIYWLIMFPYKFVLKKGIGVIVPLFDVTLSLPMLPSLRLPRFPFRLLLQVRGRMMIYWLIMVPYRFLLQPSSLLNLPLLRYSLDAKTPQSQVQHQLLRH